DGHASFRGDQAHVPHGFVAEELGKAPEVGFHRTAHPVRQELDVGPVILGQQTAGSGHDLFKSPCNGLAPDAGSKPQGPTNLMRNLPFRSDGPIVRSRIKVSFSRSPSRTTARIVLGLAAMIVPRLRW